jgi:isopenicillin N synthase-like dioxygenase
VTFDEGAPGSVPVIDIAPLLAGADVPTDVSSGLDAACRDTGFFYVSGHGVDPSLIERLDASAREFFALSEGEKEIIAMSRGGRAWRGWFPLGGELTSGRPDAKEGIYFGAELGDDDPRVQRATPMHGANLFPQSPVELGPAVLEYMRALTGVGHAILRGLAVGLGLPPSWFSEHLTDDPLVLFRIFRYPPVERNEEWSVGEHTDYGLLTILGQDALGGLEVKTRDGWMAAPPIPGTFVCNLGDMLERLTGGRYRSTAHRVRNTSRADRLSFPFFFDPSWDATVDRLPIVDRPADDLGADRWDHTSVHGFSGTYGEYITAKVSRVFPDLVPRA